MAAAGGLPSLSPSLSTEELAATFCAATCAHSAAPGLTELTCIKSSSEAVEAPVRGPPQDDRQQEPGSKLHLEKRNLPNGRTSAQTTRRPQPLVGPQEKSGSGLTSTPVVPYPYWTSQGAPPAKPMADDFRLAGSPGR